MDPVAATVGPVVTAVTGDVTNTGPGVTLGRGGSIEDIRVTQDLRAGVDLDSLGGFTKKEN